MNLSNPQRLPTIRNNSHPTGEKSLEYPNKTQRKSIGRTALLTSCSWVVLQGCGGCYVTKSAWFQSELLLSREPTERLVSSGALSNEQAEKIALIEDAKTFGGAIGLLATENYETIAWDWGRTMWNVSASDPLRFSNVTWWFPIVGRVPYLGYFRSEDAEREAQDLRDQGLDVYVRTVGAYSTLGWFKDPILPGMLQWRDDQLVETVLHEMAHATLWVAGSVDFNESFASFVGEKAMYQWLIDRHGLEGDVTRLVNMRRQDSNTWRDLLAGLYMDLDRIFSSPTLTDEEKLEMKAQLISSLPNRVRAANLSNADPYIELAEQETWNNARLAQFRTYNSNNSEFEALFLLNNSNISDFIDHVQQITTDAPEPFEAIAEAINVQIF